MRVFVKRLDLVVLGYFRGPTEAGYYRLAKSIVAVVRSLARPLQSVTYPRMVRLWSAGRHNELKRAIRRYAVMVGIPLGVLVFLSIPLLPMVVELVAGVEYLPAAFVSQIFFLAGAVYLGLFWVRPLYLATGRVRSWFGLGLINVGFVIMAYPVGAALWGAYGVAAGRATAGILNHGLATVQVFRRKGILYNDKTKSDQANS